LFIRTGTFKIDLYFLFGEGENAAGRRDRECGGQLGRVFFGNTGV
jgi:hypothetical protein